MMRWVFLLLVLANNALGQTLPTLSVFTSASPRCLDGGDVDLLHRHHRLEGTLCLIATNRKPFPFHHCRQSRSSNGPSLPDCPSRSERKKPRCAGTPGRR